MAVRMERGLFKLKYKLCHSSDYMLEPLDFLQLKIMKSQKFPEIKKKITPRGITADRKAAIVEKLLPLMPENRKSFWLNMPINNANRNLLLEED